MLGVVALVGLAHERRGVGDAGPRGGRDGPTRRSGPKPRRGKGGWAAGLWLGRAMEKVREENRSAKKTMPIGQKGERGGQRVPPFFTKSFSNLF